MAAVDAGIRASHTKKAATSRREMTSGTRTVGEAQPEVPDDVMAKTSRMSAVGTEQAQEAYVHGDVLAQT